MLLRTIHNKASTLFYLFLSLPVSLICLIVSRSNLLCPFFQSPSLLFLCSCVLFVCLSYLPVLNAYLSVSVCLCSSLSVCIPLSLSNILSLSQWLPVFLLILRLCSSQYNFNSTFSLAPSFYYTILSNSLAISLPRYLLNRYAGHISMLLRTIHNEGDIYAVSNCCLKQSVCLPVSSCLSASVWLFPDLIKSASLSLPDFSLYLCAYLFVCLSVYFCFSFFLYNQYVCLSLTRTHTPSLLSVSWSPYVCLTSNNYGFLRFGLASIWFFLY